MTENEIIEVLDRENEEFRKLSGEHKDLKEKIAEINRRVYLSPEEEMEKKNLQKLKLMKKDQMARMILRYKSEHNN